MCVTCYVSGLSYDPVHKQIVETCMDGKHAECAAPRIREDDKCTDQGQYCGDGKYMSYIGQPACTDQCAGYLTNGLCAQGCAGLVAEDGTTCGATCQSGLYEVRDTIRVCVTSCTNGYWDEGDLRRCDNCTPQLADGKCVRSCHDYGLIRSGDKCINPDECQLYRAYDTADSYCTSNCTFVDLAGLCLPACPGTYATTEGTVKICRPCEAGEV